MGSSYETITSANWLMCCLQHWIPSLNSYLLMVRKLHYGFSSCLKGNFEKIGMLGHCHQELVRLHYWKTNCQGIEMWKDFKTAFVAFVTSTTGNLVMAWARMESDLERSTIVNLDDDLLNLPVQSYERKTLIAALKSCRCSLTDFQMVSKNVYLHTQTYLPSYSSNQAILDSLCPLD